MLVRRGDQFEGAAVEQAGDDAFGLGGERLQPPCFASLACGLNHRAKLIRRARKQILQMCAYALDAFTRADVGTALGVQVEGGG